MAKRISDTERITQYFMETELAVAKAQLETVKAIIASRSKNSGMIGGVASISSVTPSTKRTRKSAPAAAPAPTQTPLENAIEAGF